MSRCSGCGFPGGGHFRLCSRVAPVSRAAPTEPPPPYSAMPAAPGMRSSCVHAWRLDPTDALVCAYCGERIYAATIAALGYRRDLPDRHDADRMRLADECGRLLSENTALLAENSRLRRDVERLTRKAGGR